MTTEHILSRLLLVVRSFTDAELCDFTSCLVDSARRQILVRFCENLLQGREADKNVRQTERVQTTQRGGPPSDRKGPRSAAVQSGNPFRVACTQVFNDRAAFPTTRDVVRAMNETFGFNLKYADFRKHGRRDLISACWRRLTALPQSVQKAKLRGFVRRLPETSLQMSDQYKKLFNVLIRNE